MTAGSVAAPQIIPIRIPPPGKAKHEIDSSIPVQIKSESPDVSILYTLDGSKPEVMKRPGFGESTRKYTEPVYLPVGKVYVRATAVARNGRQSAVVTKVFIVEPSASDEQLLNTDNQVDSLKNGRAINSTDVGENGTGVSSVKNLGGAKSGMAGQKPGLSSQAMRRVVKEDLYGDALSLSSAKEELSDLLGASSHPRTSTESLIDLMRDFSDPSTVSPLTQSMPIHQMETPMPVLQQGDDVESYLSRFECLARSLKWQREEWSSRLVPLLSGRALEAYLTMDDCDAKEYDLLKDALLQRFNISPETYRQRFRAVNVPEGELPMETYHRLRTMYRRWVRPDVHTLEEVGELIILEQFLQVLPKDISMWVKEHEPSSGQEAVTLTQQYMNAHQNVPRSQPLGDIPVIEPQKAHKGPRFLTQRLGPVSSARLTSQNLLNQSADVVESTVKSLTSTQIARIQRETDFLRCPKCLSHRPSDPFARFCLHCGSPVPPIPGQRLPPTEGGQMGICMHCITLVPLNTDKCVVCESPLAQQMQPQASLRLQDKSICHSCGTGNPAHITHCVTCESQLLQQATPVLSGQRAAPVPSSQGKMVSCPKCNRANHSDARFCDWCGAKPSHKTSSVTCSQCGASSHPYANHCGGCGVFLDGPPKTPSQVNQDQDAQEVEQNLANWQAVSAPESETTPPVAGSHLSADAQTQTVGLYYPSSTEMKKRSQQKEAELSRQEQMSDRKPLLTSISPGRGFWRKQLDHICAHLRSYTQNNTEFRALIGEPRLGRMISAVLQEDGYEVSLRINFISASPEGSRSSSAGQQSRSVASEGQNLSAVTEGRNSASTESSINKTGSEVKSKKQKKILSSDMMEKKTESKDSLLLKEVGPGGRGQISTVQQLLDEGADPKCLGSDGRPALVAAVLNGHHDVIPVLVQREADVNQESGPLKNTALHEAASLGNEGLKSVEILLGCNASIRKQNDRGQTPYDIAVASGSSSMVTLMAAHLGQGLLQRHTKAKNPSGLDTFSLNNPLFI